MTFYSGVVAFQVSLLVFIVCPLFGILLIILIGKDDYVNTLDPFEQYGIYLFFGLIIFVVLIVIGYILDYISNKDENNNYNINEDV